MHEGSSSNVNAVETMPLVAFSDFVLFPNVSQLMTLVAKEHVAAIQACETGRVAVTCELPPPEGANQAWGDHGSAANTGCCARVYSPRRTSEGVVVLLHGETRLVWEPPSASRGEVCRVTARVQRSTVSVDEVEEVPRIRGELIATVQDYAATLPGATEVLQELPRCQTSLGDLTDILAFALPLETADKCYLLGEHRVLPRARFLLERLHELPGDDRFVGEMRVRFPVQFSGN